MPCVFATSWASLTATTMSPSPSPRHRHLRGTTLDTAAAERLNDLVGRVAGVVAIENSVAETTDVVERLNPAVDRFIARTKQMLAFLPLAAVALTAFALVVFPRIPPGPDAQSLEPPGANAFIADIYRQLVRLAFVVAGLVAGLDILGASALLSTILGAAGIVGLAIGFAVKDTVENFIASIMLSVRQPFRPNDAVEINGDQGKVIRLTSRATIILSYDGNHIRIPNATVFKSRIVNFSRNPERRFKFQVGVAYDTDLAMALQLAQDTLAALPFVLKTPAVNVWIAELGGSDVALQLTAWIDQRETSLASARSEAIRMVLSAFDAAAINMPEPTYRIVSHAPDSGEKPTAEPGPTAVAAEGTAMDVHATAEEELDQIVDEEREVSKDNDLLRTQGPEE